MPSVWSAETLVEAVVSYTLIIPAIVLLKEDVSYAIIVQYLDLPQMYAQSRASVPRT